MCSIVCRKLHWLAWLMYCIEWDTNQTQLQSCSIHSRYMDNLMDNLYPYILE